jgi:hypothetical protein
VTLTQAKDLFQILAWLAAFVFFVYKLISGYLIGSASLRLSCVRTAAKNQSGVDYLYVVAILKRGAGNSVELHDAKARVTYANGQALPDLRKLPESKQTPAPVESETKLIATDRLSSWTTPAHVFQLKFHELSTRKPLLNLAPGDEMQFAALYEVAEEKPCVVEVTILAKPWGTSNRAQWRASDILLPTVQKP